MYQLEASEAQLKLIIKALDFYSRVQMGQVSELTNPFSLPLENADYTDVDKKVSDLKQSMFPDLDSNSYYAIKSKKLPDSVRQSVDIMEVLRHRLSWDNTTEESPTGIQYQKPFQWSNELPLVSIKKIEDK